MEGEEEASGRAECVGEVHEMQVHSAFVHGARVPWYVRYMWEYS